MDTSDSTASTLAQLQAQCSEYTKELLAPNTRLNYGYAWGEFARWSKSMGLVAMPAEPQTVKWFVAFLLSNGKKVTTAKHRIAAIRRQHLSCNQPSPITQEVLDVLRGARRCRGDQLRQALPLTITELRQICVMLRADGTAISIRNLALILTGFTGAFRNSETAALQLAHLKFTDEGALLWIPKSKTDQEGHGIYKALPHGKHSETDVVGALKKYIEEFRGSEPGPLFLRFRGASNKKNVALLPERIGQIVQELAQRIGLKTTGHGLRSGFVTAAGTAGATDLNTGAHAGMTSMDTVRRYFRKRNAFIANPNVLLDL